MVPTHQLVKSVTVKSQLEIKILNISIAAMPENPCHENITNKYIYSILLEGHYFCTITYKIAQILLFIHGSLLS